MAKMQGGSAGSTDILPTCSIIREGFHIGPTSKLHIFLHRHCISAKRLRKDSECCTDSISEIGVHDQQNLAASSVL